MRFLFWSTQISIKIGLNNKVVHQPTLTGGIMSIFVNINISLLNAQRQLTESEQVLNQANQRPSVVLFLLAQLRSSMSLYKLRLTSSLL
jgi:hypothetical protein